MRKVFPILTIAALMSAQQVFAIDLITVNFEGDVSAQEQQAFNDAAAFWNSVITGYKAPYFYENDGQTVQAGPHSLVITASSPDLGGPGGTLGEAGPTTLVYADNDNQTPNPTYARYYTKTGTMKFDSWDTPGLLANGTFFGVVLHEMGHVLGLGTLWSTNTNAGAGFGNLYNPTGPTGTFNGETVGMYTGQHALAGWRTEFNQPGADFVPVEKGGTEGTFDGHWNEFDGGPEGIEFGPKSAISGLDFSHELMTGWASDTFFLSTVTLGGLEDLGYEVDYSKAGPIAAVPEISPFAFTAGAAVLLLVRRRRKVR